LHPDFSFDVFVKYCYTVNNKSIIETSIYINEDLYYEILRQGRGNRHPSGERKTGGKERYVHGAVGQTARGQNLVSDESL
jgi:hypothetical protein